MSCILHTEFTSSPIHDRNVSESFNETNTTKRQKKYVTHNKREINYVSITIKLQKRKEEINSYIIIISDSFIIYTCYSKE